MRALVVSLLIPGFLTFVGCGDGSSTSTEGSGAQGGQSGSGGSGAHGGSGGTGGHAGSGGTGAQGGSGGTAGTGGQTTGMGGSLTLDLAYGEDGVAHARHDLSDDVIHAAVWTADGHILCGGTTSGPAIQNDALLMRFTSSGQLDATFGSGGHTLLPFGDNTFITRIEPLPDAGALVAGVTLRYGDTRAFVARVDAQGVLDTTFGNAGVTLLEMGYVEQLVALARGGSGQIAVLASSTTAFDSWLWRLDEDGQIDPTFGDNGHVTLDGENPRDLVYQPDGKILALTEFGGGRLYRIDEDGSPDSSFGAGGEVEPSFEPYDVDLGATGSILLTGGGPNGGVLKLDAAGDSDLTFGVSGYVDLVLDEKAAIGKWLSNGDVIVVDAYLTAAPQTIFKGIQKLAADGTPVAFDASAITPILGSQGNVAAVLEKDGDLYFPGSHNPSDLPFRREVMIVGTSAGGALLPAFGDAGLAEQGSHARPETLRDMAFRPDGSLIAVGTAGFGGALARFAGGQHDVTFGDGGFALQTFFPNYGVTVDVADHILVLGPGTLIARHAADGKVDTMFGDLGSVQVMPASAVAAALGTDAQGRIVLAGHDNAGGAAFVARVLQNGTLDGSFALGGVFEDPALLPGWADAVLVEPDGKVVLAGLSTLPESFFARLLEDGSPDPGFGGQGKTSIPEKIRISRVARRAPGGYFAAGHGFCPSYADCPIVVTAVTADGALDTSFGEAGFATIGPARQAQQTLIGLVGLPDGGVVIGGAVDNGTADQFAVWRLQPNGTLDLSFGDAGVFLLPGRGRATQVLLEGTGVLVGGWASDPVSGTDMVTVRFSF